MSNDERRLGDDLQIKSETADPGSRIRTILNRLNSHSPLIHIDLSFANLQLNSLKLLAQYLNYNKTVQVLNLKGNQIGDQGAMIVASVLEQNRSIRRLILSRNQIGHQSSEHLATALSRNQSLTNLDLSYNGICAEGVRALAQSVSRLRWLNVRHNAIRDEGAAAIGQGLQNLLFADLADNQIGPKGIRALSHALAANRSLVMLDLSRNEVGVRGAGYLAKILGQTRLRILVLQQNAIDDQGAFALLQQNALECLDLRRNPLSAQVRLWPASTTAVLCDAGVDSGDDHAALDSGKYSWGDAEDFDDGEFRQNAGRLSDYYQ